MVHVFGSKEKERKYHTISLLAHRNLILMPSEEC